MDKNTFEEKVLETEQTMYHMAKSILPCEADCEDAVSEAVLKAYLKLDTLRDETYFKTWLIRILLRECYRKRKNNTLTVSYENYFQETPAQTEEYTDLYQSVMRLKEKIRVPIILYYIEGYSVEEIRTILKIPAGTVKSRLARGRVQLRSLLKEEVVL